jgi:hypothetical protein
MRRRKREGAELSGRRAESAWRRVIPAMGSGQWPRRGAGERGCRTESWWGGVASFLLPDFKHTVVSDPCKLSCGSAEIYGHDPHIRTEDVVTRSPMRAWAAQRLPRLVTDYASGRIWCLARFGRSSIHDIASRVSSAPRPVARQRGGLLVRILVVSVSNDARGKD